MCLLSKMALAGTWWFLFWDFCSTTHHTVQTHSCQGLESQLRGTQFSYNQHIHVHRTWWYSAPASGTTWGQTLRRCAQANYFSMIYWFLSWMLRKSTNGLIKLLIKAPIMWLKGTGGNLCSQSLRRRWGLWLLLQVTQLCGLPALPLWKAAALWQPKAPGQRGMSPSRGHSPILRQPWLHCGFAAWPGKDSQIQGTPSFFFISPVKIVMNIKKFQSIWPN